MDLLSSFSLSFWLLAGLGELITGISKWGFAGELGQINTDNLLIGLVLTPLAWIGIRLSLTIHKTLNDKLFYRIILIMFLMIGIKLIADGI